ncbi:hypothetical protein SAMN05443634_10798 [Chishuiella changwenlii]|uniref:Uncharacterized protein n=1 Tax=Chishuiella changwenlii TaxID=1434701 RepID=A0A1M6YZ49_9FLAO|nr:hypothetical protein SAMN05443634_10798 [Chishuiella changwenlii]
MECILPNYVEMNYLFLNFILKINFKKLEKAVIKV